jgi:aryl-alcohol dehydrogenase-like predicted oxidoreductase
MKHTSLGQLDVSRIGLGAMAMSGYYLDPRSSDAESIRTIRRALDLGVTHIDTAEIYGPFANEKLVGRALNGRRDDVVVATKFGLVSHSGGGPGVIDSSPGNIRTAVEGSLQRLGTDHIDLYYQHRVDPNTPIEDTIGALAELVTEGKIRHIGLSEVPVEHIEAARKIARIVSVQNRYNLADRAASEVLDHCERENIAFIPWFPLATGELAGEGSPVAKIAAEKGVSPSQLALAWLLHRSPVILPIPGTSSVAHLEDNVAAAGVSLTDDEMAALTAAAG